MRQGHPWSVATPQRSQWRSLENRCGFLGLGSQAGDGGQQRGGGEAGMVGDGRPQGRGEGESGVGAAVTVGRSVPRPWRSRCRAWP